MYYEIMNKEIFLEVDTFTNLAILNYYYLKYIFNIISNFYKEINFKYFVLFSVFLHFL